MEVTQQLYCFSKSTIKMQMTCLIQQKDTLKMQQTLNCLTHANAGHLKGICVYQSHSTEVQYASASLLLSHLANTSFKDLIRNLPHSSRVISNFKQGMTTPIFR